MGESPYPSGNSTSSLEGLAFWNMGNAIGGSVAAQAIALPLPRIVSQSNIFQSLFLEGFTSLTKPRRGGNRE